MPKETWDFANSSKWDPEWTGALSADRLIQPTISPIKAWSPYILIGFLLVITRMNDLPFGNWLKQASIQFENVLGTSISIESTPLFLPGFIMIVVSAIGFFLYKMSGKEYGLALSSSAKMIISAAPALLFSVPLVQVFINSDINALGYESMPLLLAESVSNLTGDNWPVIAPAIGALGAFVAGSNTISNMMFSLFQFGTAENVGVNPATVVALQAVGGAAGNMICVHNVVAASAAAGIVGKEGVLIRKVMIPLTYYLVFAGGLGYVAIHGVGINIGTLLVVAVILVLVILMIKYGRSGQQYPNKKQNKKSSNM